MTTLITNIKELLQVESVPKKMVFGAAMKFLPTIKNAFLLIENNVIKDFGKMENLPIILVENTIDASGKMVLPTWCDSHTHIVYAGNREQEFIDRIHGLSYEEISETMDGGILNSSHKITANILKKIYTNNRQNA